MSRNYAKEFLELNRLNVPHRYLQFIVSDILNFKIINVLTTLMTCPVLSPVDNNGVATGFCNKKLKLVKNRNAKFIAHRA